MYTIAKFNPAREFFNLNGAVWMEELAELDPLCSEYSIYTSDTTLALSKSRLYEQHF